MVILYNIGLYLFYIFVLIASVFNTKARKWIGGRNGQLKQLKKRFGGADKVMWMHCSSLGEFEQGRPVLEEFRRLNPRYKILLSFFSSSGYEMQKDYNVADYVHYIPLDTWLNATKFIKAVHPDIVFFVKYDLWYHHLHHAKKHGAKLYLISAVFHPKQAFFKWYGSFFRSMLRTFNRIFVQNKGSKQLLLQIGVNDVLITGNTRIDRVKQIAQHAKEYPLIKQFTNNLPCLICGSTWPKDEEIIAKAIDAIPEVKTIIAPHEIHESHIVEIEKLFKNKQIVRYTRIENENIAQYDILIVDTIGMLSSIYQYGQAAYIGGGFGDGIHNTLEAVVFGIPVIFGPNYNEFIEAGELVESGGAVNINNVTELQTVLTSWFGNNNSRGIAGDICKKYIWEQQNATEKTLQNL
jgi:3-deoxy-D-manno-octulosonic-acid transferase